MSTATAERDEVGEAREARRATQMPKPMGYKILLGLPEVAETFDGTDIVKAHETKDFESVATIVGFVIEMGPDAYSDTKRFPSGPYCKVGDFVLFRAFAGTRIKVHGVEFRLINDDTVEAVVQDPQGIYKA